MNCDDTPPYFTHLFTKNGNMMPILGMGLGGTSWVKNEVAKLEAAIDDALESGYRHFDTGFSYSTEESLGKCLTKWTGSGKGTREELFIATKLPRNGMQPHLVEHFLNLSLKNLNLTYVDLYLIHWPIGVKYVSDTDFDPVDEHGVGAIDPTTNLDSIWKAMEAQVDAGRAKSIGISNFTSSQIERVISSARIFPSNLQIEVHAYFAQKELIKFCDSKGITVCAFCPLGSPHKKIQAAQSGRAAPNAANMLDDPVVQAIAEKHKKIPAQILLRYLIQRGVAVVPKSCNAERLRQNIDVFNFELGVTDIHLLEGLDQGDAGRSVPSPKGCSHHPEIPF